MPLPADVSDELERRRAAEEREARRETRRDLTRTALACLAWAALGIASILTSAHTTNMWVGQAAFYGGIGVGNAGIIFTLLAAYRRGEQRGDW